MPGGAVVDGFDGDLGGGILFAVAEDRVVLFDGVAGDGFCSGVNGGVDPLDGFFLGGERSRAWVGVVAGVGVCADAEMPASNAMAQDKIAKGAGVRLGISELDAVLGICDLLNDGADG